MTKKKDSLPVEETTPKPKQKTVLPKIFRNPETYYYIYRCAAGKNSMYPYKDGVRAAKAKGYTDDCTGVEYEKYFNQKLRKSLTPYKLMRKRVIT